MRQMASYLIQEDEKVLTEYAFVLGGNSLDRGNEAFQLYKSGTIKKIVCTGENIPSVLEAVGKPMTEAELTADYLKNTKEIPDSLIEIINEGTSTREESYAILEFCKRKNIKSATLISSKFHLRRVRNVFEAVFADEGIILNFQGCVNSKFNEMEWWKTEEGMIAINNEYIKLIYYWWTD